MSLTVPKCEACRMFSVNTWGKRLIGIVVVCPLCGPLCVQFPGRPQGGWIGHGHVTSCDVM